jgi:uncharacterized protein YbbK (DUF523 family)
VSSCLLGQRVRYDGVEKRIPWVSEILSIEVELVPICPEVGAGMSVPRPPIQLVERGAGRREVALVTGAGDVHTAMRAFCDTMRVQLEANGLHGYLFKARSPSCGIRDTPHFSESGAVLRKGAGLWAETCMQRWPELPIADESDVSDQAGQQAFLQRVREFWGGIGSGHQD